ncbi:hypothetical protein UlMin_002109 [Ulmus minor]
MAEGPKVRLVRCPTCRNLLPELPEYSVYQCGGCGTVLRAKKQVLENDVLSVKSDEEKSGGGSEKLDILVEERGGSSLRLASESEMENDGIELGRRKESLSVGRKAEYINDSLPLTENKGVLVDERPSVAEKENGSADRHSRLSDHRMDHWARGSDQYMNRNRSESVNSRASMDRWAAYGNHGMGSEQRRSSTIAYSGEGPSNYLSNNRDHVNVPDGIENLEHERLELLRRLDELKEQVKRSYNVADEPREREPVDRYLHNPYGNRFNYSVSTQPPALDRQIPRPPFFNHSSRPGSFMNHHNIDMQNLHPPRRHFLNEIPEHGDPFQPPMMRKPPHQPPQLYSRIPPHEYHSGQYLNFNSEPLDPYPHETFFHAPACCCVHCFNQNQSVPPQIPPSKASISTNFYHHDNHATFGPQTYNPQVANPPFQSLDSQRHPRWPSDLDSDTDGYGQNYRRRVVPTHGKGRLCYPIAGGAPFITCYNCFELLKLPRKLWRVDSNQLKIRCGACSTVILLKIENKKLIISGLGEPKHSTPEVDRTSREGVNADYASSCSEEFKNSGYKFQSPDVKHNLVVEDRRLNLDEPERRHSHTSSSSISSKEEENPHCVITQKDVSDSPEAPLQNALSPITPGSPAWQKAESPGNTISKDGLGNRSRHSDRDDMVFNRIISRQTVTDTLEATELDVSFNEYLNTNISQDYSPDESKEEDRLSKGTDSFLVGFIKKSFRDFSRSNHSIENERPKVSINGQPIPDRVVKKAEKLAGKIRPGDYWYDFRAGFWGVMGQPCLGIIPPFIEEFNYPMPTSCGAGNTGVYINGRELNQRDLDLLSKRGLPTTKEKFYIVEISGKVLEEDSGEELDNLGKLAPTVENLKRGFGMKVP